VCKAGKDSKLFDRNYGSAQDEEASAVIALPDGFALGGFGCVTGGNEDLLLTRTDLGGNLLWQKAYGTSAAERTPHEAGLCRPAVGDGFALAGYRVVALGSSGAEVVDGLAVRTDDAGKEVWQKQLGGAQNDLFFTCTANADGSLMFAGQTNSKGGGESDAWLVRLDSGGGEVYDFSFGTALADRFVIALPVGDGGRLGVGVRTVAAGDGEMWAVRIEPTGKQFWSLTYGKGASYETVHDAVMLPDGGFVLGGGTNHGGDWNAYFVHIDAAGTKLWDKPLTVAKHDFVFDLMLRPDGRVVYTDAAGWLNNSLTEGDGYLGLFDDKGGFYWHRTYESATPDQLRQAAWVGDGTMALAGHKPGLGGKRDVRLMRVDVNGAPNCTASGGCDKAPGCDDGNPCALDQCDAVLGCKNSPAQDGIACEAGACSVLDTCSAGKCVAPGKARQFVTAFGATADDELAAVVERPGGYTLLGRTGQSPHHDLQLTKLDAAGKILAQYNVGGPVTNRSAAT
jgi:hypothetical protein